MLELELEIARADESRIAVAEIKNQSRRVKREIFRAFCLLTDLAKPREVTGTTGPRRETHFG